MFRSFGPLEIIVIVGVLFLLFGATRLPQIGHSAGKSLLEFKRGLTGHGIVGRLSADDKFRKQPRQSQH